MYLSFLFAHPILSLSFYYEMYLLILVRLSANDTCHIFSKRNCEIESRCRFAKVLATVLVFKVLLATLVFQVTVF
jgi:hypothetical protein